MGAWITPVEMLDRTAFYHFYKNIDCSASAEIALKISADSRYQLRVNGEYVCEGPCTGDHSHWRYEEVTVPSEYLRDGENEIYIRVLHLKGDHFDPVARGERPALWVKGAVTDGGKTIALVSDESWKCYIDEGIFFVNNAPAVISPCMPPCVNVESENDLREVSVKPYVAERLADGGFTPYGLADKYLLEPRTIPHLKPSAPVKFKKVGEGKGYIILDAGVYTTAYPTFIFKGKAGGFIKFTYAEAFGIPDARGRLTKGMRDAVGTDLTGAFDNVCLNGKEQSFTFYWYRAFRMVRVDFSPETELIDAYYEPFFYPLEETGTFECSEAVRNSMWEVSKNTLLCCTHETFVDCPYYEQCQYDMDSAIEMMVMLRLTGDSRMAKKCLTDLARSQQADGMLCAHYPSTKVQIIPNFSSYWILMLRDYVTCTGDLDFADEMLPVAEKVLNFFRRHRTAEGLCDVTPYWHYTDWVPSWVRGMPPEGHLKPITLTTLIYSAALSATASLCREVGRDGLASEYEKRAEEANIAVNTYCFDSAEGKYIDVYGAPAAYSEHTAVWAVLCGAKTGDEAKTLMDTTFDPAAKVHRATFSFNYYAFRALEKTGLYKKYAPILFKGWEKMLDLHCTTWCENPDNPRSECHAWSAAPVYENSAMVLGVQPLTTGYGEVLIKPDTDFCEWAKGTVPTPHGIISVSWETVDGCKLLKISAPSRMKKHIVLPSGDEIVTDAELYTAKV